MTAPLNLSVNELSSLLRQVCKATYTAYHDYITIRETVLWMEVQGFNGLNALLGDFNEATVCPRRDDFGGDSMSWFLGGESLLPIAHMAGDLILAESHDQPTSTFQIKAAQAPAALLPEIIRFADAGLTARLSLNGVNFAACKMGEAVIFKPARDWPVLAQSIEIILGDETLSLDTPAITAEHIKILTETAYAEGVSVRPETYELLNQRAALCLVPSTEESRRGAGE